MIQSLHRSDPLQWVRPFYVLPIRPLQGKWYGKRQSQLVLQMKDIQHGFRVGDWRAYPQRNVLEGPAGEVHIEPKVMQVLEFLAQRPGEVVQRDSLLNSVWEGRAFSDEPLTRCIAALRRTFGDSPKDPNYIQTIPKSGYRLVCRVEPLGDHGEAQKGDLDAVPDSQGRAAVGRRQRIVWPVAAGLVLIAAIYVTLQFSSLRPVDTPQLTVEGTKRAASPVYSIAVLPFVNMSADPEQEFFSDGLAEEALMVLARIPDLAVTPRASAFRFRGNERNIPEIADDLDVELVLTGSVRKAGNRVRIAAELINVHDDRQLWSEIFDRQLDDVFAIQEEIAQAIGRTLKIRIADIRGNAISVAGTRNVDAHNAYLKGRYLFHKLGTENRRLAIEYFEKAIDLDPEFAMAHAALGITKSVGWGVRDPALATLSANRALTLDRSLPMAWIAVGQSAAQEFRFEEAEQAFREAAALAPNNAFAWHMLGSRLWDRGETEEALQMALRAVSLDPTSPMYRTFLGEYYLNLGQVETGMRHLDEALELNWTVHHFVTKWKAATGDIDGALEISEAAMTKAGSDRDFLAFNHAFILVAAGRLDEARALVAGREGETADSSPVAIVFAYLGDIANSNRIIEKAFGEGFTMPSIRTFAPYMPDYPMRQTRYNEFRSSIGLPGIDDK